MRNNIGSETAPYTYQSWGGGIGRVVPAQAYMCSVYTYERGNWHRYVSAIRRSSFGTDTAGTRINGEVIVLFVSSEFFTRALVFETSAALQA